MADHTHNLCIETNCKRRRKARGLCELHYDRAEAAGCLHKYPTKKAKPGATMNERLRHIGWDEVDRGRPGITSPCWEWRGARNDANYGFLFSGVYQNGNKKRPVPILAPRAAYRTWVGPIPDGQIIRHRCDNPPCVNPEHLVTGTNADNSRDMVSRFRTKNGENRPHKLKDDEVVAIRVLYSAGNISQRALAVQFGVSQQLVSHLVRGTRRPAPTRR